MAFDDPCQCGCDGDDGMTLNNSVDADHGCGRLSQEKNNPLSVSDASFPDCSSSNPLGLSRTASSSSSSQMSGNANVLLEEAGYDSSSALVSKRKDYISWDDYFMAIAMLSAHRSKDPEDATGACIVDASNRVIGIGYSGFPAGADDDVLPWTNRTSSAWLHTKTPYLIPAPINAILNKCAADCSGARLYTPSFPCNECAKIIIQARIGEIIYMNNDFHDSDSIRASRILLTMANVRIRQYTPEKQELNLDFSKVLGEQDLQVMRGDTSTQSDSKSGPQQTLNHFRDLLVMEANYDPVYEGSSKRKNSLSWDDYFMAMAFLTAQRSKDPNTQVGACIVDSNRRIVGLGYNGFPAGCSDDDLPWARQANSELHKKYAYVVHAEVNAILNKGSADLRGATLYVALFPCNECAKVIIQAGIQEVVYMADQYHDSDSCRASRILLQMAGIRVRKHIPRDSSLNIRIYESSS